MNSITISAPAKINIGLNIISKRTDGFHDLETLFYPIHDLYDLVKIKKSEKDSFSWNCETEIKNEDNLILRAKNLLEKKVDKQFTVEIDVEKNIPIGAGLGGGSSNAAAVLLALNKIYKLNLSYDDLCSISLELGSDVPFFINPLPSFGKSRGEILEKMNFNIKHPIVIVNPGIHVSTKEAFGNIIPGPGKNLYNFIKDSSNHDYNLFRKNISNDFEDYIFRIQPEVGKIKDELYNCSAEFSMMSGTGSTVYGIFKDKNSAESAAGSFPKEYFTFISLPSKL